MKINVTPEEFSNVIISYLLDCILHKDEINMSEEFEEVVDILDMKGSKAFLLMKYLRMDANERMNYKKIRKSLIDLNFKGVIEIDRKKE